MLFKIFFLMLMANAQLDNEMTFSGKVRKVFSGPSSPAPGERSVVAEFTRCEDRTVHLTFDDGPNLNTLQILEILKKHNVKATFFVLGENIQTDRNKEIIKLIKEQGHTIGLHGYTHRNFAKSHPQDIKNEFELLDKTLEQDLEGGKKLKDYISPIFRLPYGAGWLRNSQKDLDSVHPISAKAIFENLNKRSWGHMGWHVDSLDHKVPTDRPFSRSSRWPADIAEETKKQKGGVILFHDTKPNTTVILDQFLSKYKKDFCVVDGATYGTDQSLKIMKSVGNKKFCQ